jgi:hypothetical protein
MSVGFVEELAGTPLLRPPMTLGNMRALQSRAFF